MDTDRQFAAVLRKRIFNAQTCLLIVTAYTLATVACVTLLLIQKQICISRDA